jgi:E3 ubiquitin-protein ligase UHRF1
MTRCHSAGKLMCRFLFRRCDNEAAPWSSSTAGDGAWDDDLPEEATDEMNKTPEPVHCPSGQAYWDYDSTTKTWRWFRSPPVSAAKPRAAPSLKKEEGAVCFSSRTAVTIISATLESQHFSGFSDAHSGMQVLRSLARCNCGLCKAILAEPVCTPCGHQFCKSCLQAQFQDCVENRSTARTLRTRKQRKPCPACNADLSDFVEGVSFQVNQAMKSQITLLQSKLTDLHGKMQLADDASASTDE